MDVFVIGTDPPCPRCDLLGRMVEEKQRSGIRLNIRHIAYDTPEAAEIAETYGKRMGTAREVAEAAGVEIDWRAVYAEMDRAAKAAGPGASPADAWTPALDALLAPCEKAADEVGYLMTPVLIVDGLIRHHGSVPPEDVLSGWFDLSAPD